MKNTKIDINRPYTRPKTGIVKRYFRYECYDCEKKPFVTEFEYLHQLQSYLLENTDILFTLKD